MAEGRGLPLLSGPPPQMEGAESCRKCGKEFNMFLNRSRRCNHCGYSYCHSCTDYQALMPRRNESQAGYDSMNVCAYCIEFLTITAGGRGYLKSLPLGKLKKYVDAYNIKIDRAVEKDDLIDGILNARSQGGCLPLANESYYRKYSVPDRSNTSNRSRGFFSRSGQGSNNAPQPPQARPPPGSQNPTYNFPRPDLEPDSPPRHQHQHQQHYSPPPGPPPHQYHHQHPSPPPRPPPVPPRPGQQHYNSAGNYTHPIPPPNYGYQSSPQYSTHPPPPPPGSRPQSRPQQQSYMHPGYGPYQRPSASHSSHNVHQTNNNRTTPRPRAASAAPPPPPTPPTLDELLELSKEAISSLSISTLKEILFINHVNAGLILEKGELVEKVKILIDDEKRERERQRVIEEQEEAERIERQRVLIEQHNMAMREREEKAKAEKDSTADSKMEGVEQTPGSSSTPPPPPKPRGTAADLERTGLCVVCQDDEANIAIVDCGHLAMCRGCSDLIMASSRECPLCRTRIVTEARLLRIFKT